MTKTVLDEVNTKINSLLSRSGVFESSDDETAREDDYFRHLKENDVERFIDGLLLILGELESEDAIPEMKTTADVRNAINAVIKKIYSSKGVISKMTNKYRRYGAARTLRQARADISKALRP